VFGSAAEIKRFRNSTKVSEMTKFQSRKRIPAKLSPFNHQHVNSTNRATPKPAHGVSANQGE
jgi:hypothetical protein